MPNVVNLKDRFHVISGCFEMQLFHYLYKFIIMQNICLYLLQTIVSQNQFRSTCIYAFQSYAKMYVHSTC